MGSFFYFILLVQLYHMKHLHEPHDYRNSLRHNPNLDISIAFFHLALACVFSLSLSLRPEKETKQQAFLLPCRWNSVVNLHFSPKTTSHFTHKQMPFTFPYLFLLSLVLSFPFYPFLLHLCSLTALLNLFFSLLIQAAMLSRQFRKLLY